MMHSRTTPGYLYISKLSSIHGLGSGNTTAIFGVIGPGYGVLGDFSRFVWDIDLKWLASSFLKYLARLGNDDKRRVVRTVSQITP